MTREELIHALYGIFHTSTLSADVNVVGLHAILDRAIGVPVQDEVNMTPACLAELCGKIEAHWACCDGPARASFQMGDGAVVYRVFGYVAPGGGNPDDEGLEREMCDKLYADLLTVNDGGLLVYRRRPRIEYNEMERTTTLSVRLAFVGGLALSRDDGEEPRSLKREGQPLAQLRPLLEDVSWLRGALFGAIEASGGDLTISASILERITKPGATISYEYPADSDTLRLRTR